MASSSSQTNGSSPTSALSELTAITPVDGRYRGRVNELAAYFSEFALIRYRVRIEVEYFIALCQLPVPPLRGVGSPDLYAKLRTIYALEELVGDVSGPGGTALPAFGEEAAREIKATERVTNHDVKAVEYYVKRRLGEFGLAAHAEWVHFALTSQDVNNTAIPLLLREATAHSYLPALSACVLEPLREMVEKYADVAMLSRTHGQPATPTRLGKEIAVFVERIETQLRCTLPLLKFSAKFGGATGGLNAHLTAYPGEDWRKFANDFVCSQLGLDREQNTTQVGHYDNQAALFDMMRRVNVILLDLCKDFWTYISLEYFGQRITKGEVGSSTMPHKVNPIDFENAEGNLGLANALLSHLSSKLPISRLQRDLTDSTVWRSAGMPFAHTLLAFRSLQRGLSKLWLRSEVLTADLERNFVVVAEPVQTILRREGVQGAYEKLKDLTRTGERLNQDGLNAFVDTLDVSDEVKSELKAISPHTYIGYPAVLDPMPDLVALLCSSK